MSPNETPQGRDPQPQAQRPARPLSFDDRPAARDGDDAPGGKPKRRITRAIELFPEDPPPQPEIANAAPAQAPVDAVAGDPAPLDALRSQMDAALEEAIRETHFRSWSNWFWGIGAIALFGGTIAVWCYSDWLFAILSFIGISVGFLVPVVVPIVGWRGRRVFQVFLDKLAPEWGRRGKLFPIFLDAWMDRRKWQPDETLKDGFHAAGKQFVTSQDIGDSAHDDLRAHIHAYFDLPSQTDGSAPGNPTVRSTSHP